MKFRPPVRRPTVKRPAAKPTTPAPAAPAKPAGIRTQLFESYGAWAAAGHPVGGVFPAGDDRWGDAEAWPDRYRSAVAYYVVLPTSQLWCPWQRAYNAERGYHGEGWNVSGPPEKLTCTPSIQVKGWHGYLTNGELHE